MIACLLVCRRRWIRYTIGGNGVHVCSRWQWLARLKFRIAKARIPRARVVR